MLTLKKHTRRWIVFLERHAAVASLISNPPQTISLQWRTSCPHDLVFTGFFIIITTKGTMWQRNSTYRRWLWVTRVLEGRHFRRDSQRCSLYIRWLPLAKDGELEHHKENERAYRKTTKRGVIWTWVGYPKYTFAFRKNCHRFEGKFNAAVVSGLQGILQLQQ